MVIKTISKALAAGMLCFASLAHAQDIVTLQTRPGVTQSYFLARVPAKPQAVAVLFPGSGGLIRLQRENGQIRFDAGNFSYGVEANSSTAASSRLSWTRRRTGKAAGA